jgi:hypothetical protein
MEKIMNEILKEIRKLINNAIEYRYSLKNKEENNKISHEDFIKLTREKYFETIIKIDILIEEKPNLQYLKTQKFLASYCRSEK